MKGCIKQLFYYDWYDSTLDVKFVQGLCEQTVKVLQIMESDGIELNLIMLNVLINAFGIAGRHMEALSIYHHMKEIVSPYLMVSCHLMSFFLLILVL